ncbi:hypothetical protein E2562_001082 [Oryza meyeriana var. granulata]|uniref:Uncharacterized protein n=1 Tax=Oryza meyeriana var. granulata TaxID=110450 RepID=A0A6G1EC46_9ORYZ|nr:hypothetical protein E2562_001082 [Oryza meyeriana var. granulata]
MDRASSSPPLPQRASRSWLGAVFGGTARMVLFAGFLATKFLTEAPHLLAVLTSETSASESVFNAVTKAVDAFRAASQAFIGVGGVLLIMAATFATVASPVALVVDVIVATTQPPRQNIAEPPPLLANQNLPQDLARDDDDIEDFNRRSIVGLLLISILILCYRGVGLKKV